MMSSQPTEGSLARRQADITREDLPCVLDPEGWFATDPDDERTAVQHCRTCPLTAQCLDFALAHDHRYGIWGANTPADRKRLREQARQAL